MEDTPKKDERVIMDFEGHKIYDSDMAEITRRLNQIAESFLSEEEKVIERKKVLEQFAIK